MKIWIRNTDGKPDAVLTMALWCLVVILVKLVFSGFALTVGTWSIGAGSVDGGIIAALLSPTLGAYVARRYTDKMHRGTVTVKGVPEGQSDR